MDIWNIEIPIPFALALVCALGYWIGRRQRTAGNELIVRSRRELERAKAVAAELEKIAWTVRQSLAKHHASVSRFKDRMGKLGNRQQDSAWKDLCREAEEVLKPTLHLAAQIANAYDEIRQQSAHLMSFTEVRIDPLTGVNNRRGLDDALATQFAMMTRYKSTFSVVMFDIDHFKSVNDREGHLYGDRVLRELAQLLDESVRDTDLVARYGGEEFVVVMPQTDLDGVCLFSERLREQVRSKLSITVSGGAAAGCESDTPETLMKRADAALYAAKMAGRNRVFSHNGQTCEPVLAAEAISV